MGALGGWGAAPLTRAHTSMGEQAWEMHRTCPPTAAMKAEGSLRPGPPGLKWPRWCDIGQGRRLPGLSSPPPPLGHVGTGSTSTVSVVREDGTKVGDPPKAAGATARTPVQAHWLEGPTASTGGLGATSPHNWHETLGNYCDRYSGRYEFISKPRQDTRCSWEAPQDLLRQPSLLQDPTAFP